MRNASGLSYLRGIARAALGALALTSACDDAPSTHEDVRLAAERWSDADDPGASPIPLTTEFADLPLEGEVAVTPWPGYAWETYRDSLNYRWAGGDSPSAIDKYARAFGAEGLDDVVSALYGVGMSPTVARCTQDAQCADQEHCGFHQGQEQGYCIPFWWGLCHAWSIASILEPEPRRAVKLGDVTFDVNDIKGLLVLAYDRPSLVFVSQRCNDNGDLGEIEYDENDRPASECRDINPGAFHVFLANYVGRLRTSFSVDVVYDDAVGNLPIRSYRVQKAQDIGHAEAVSLVGDVLSADTASVKLIDLEVRYVLSSGPQDNGNLTQRIEEFTTTVEYSYLLELDDDGAIIGGEWVGDSRHEHPDFLRIAKGPGTKPIASGFITYSRVKQLVSAAQEGSSLVLEQVQRQGQIEPGEWQFFGPFDVGEDGLIDASVTSKGNVELFLYRKGALSTQEYLCRRRFAQTSGPCVAEGSGSYEVAVVGRSAGTSFELSVLYGREQ